MPTFCLQASLNLGFQSTWLLLGGGLFHHHPFHVDEGALTVSTLFIVIFMLVLLYTFSKHLFSLFLIFSFPMYKVNT